MKRIIIFTFTISMLLINGAFAQNKTQLKEYNGVVYEYNPTNRILENKANNLLKQENKVKLANTNICSYRSDQKPEYFLSLFKPIFSKERANELIGNPIAIISLIDHSGKIAEIRFLSRSGFDFLTAKEIYQLEQCYKLADLQFKSTCEDQDLYYLMDLTLNYQRLYDNYDKLP